MMVVLLIGSIFSILLIALAIASAIQSKKNRMDNTVGEWSEVEDQDNK